MSWALSLAGFQVTLIGRFWVTPEAAPTQVNLREHSVLCQIERFMAAASMASRIGLADLNRSIRQ
jgi:hypothetical protein